MITVDYLIERNEGDEIVTYSPKLLPTEYDNVVYIKGPNACGKSTLLNIIALAFFGNKLPELDQTLKNRLLNLLDLDHQKIKFLISFNNPELGFTLTSKKRNLNTLDISVEIETKEGVRQLNPDSFFREYKLIYDIPTNPLERLPQLLVELKTTQNELGQKIGILKDFLRTIIEEIGNSKDPNKLDELINKIDELKRSYDNLEIDLNIIKSHRRKVEIYYLYKFYINANDEYKEQQKLLSELNQRLHAVELEGRRSTRTLTNLERKINNDKTRLLELYNDSYIKLKGILPESEKVHLRAWKETNINNEINYSEIYKTIREKTKYFINIIENLLENERIIFNTELKSIEVYRRLLAALSEVRFNDVFLPGFDQTVENFKQILSNELNNFTELENRILNISVCIEILKEFYCSLNSTIKLVIEYKENTNTPYDESGFDVDVIRNEIKTAVSITDALDKKIGKLRSQMISKNLDPSNPPKSYYETNNDPEIKPFEIMSEESIKQELQKIDMQISLKSKQLERLSESLKVKNQEIVLMNSKKPHIHREYLNDLDSLFISIQRVEQRFKTVFSKNISHIIEQTRLSDDDLFYADLLSELLAKKIVSIKHIDNEYQVKKLDLVNREIVTEGNKTIRFEDLGTGQSQAGFLLAKLAMSENKKIIALFDEVAMMDEYTLQPVKDRLNQLYKENKLIMAIIVQKSETISIESLL